MFPANNYGSLSPLQRIRISSPGGLCCIHAVPVQNVLYIPDLNPQYGTITEKIRLKDGKVWYLIPVPNRGRALTEMQNSNDGGPYVDSLVTGFLPFDSAQNEVTLTRMRMYRWIVSVALPNGLKKLLGSLDSPVYISRNFDSGADGSGDAGSAIQFSWSSPDGPPVYLGIPSDDEIVALPPVFLLGDGKGNVLGSGSTAISIPDQNK